jgi:hypothetical protein
MALIFSLGVVRGCTKRKRVFEGKEIIENDLFERGVLLYPETDDGDSVGVIPYDATIEELDRLHGPSQLSKKFVTRLPLPLKEQRH